MIETINPELAKAELVLREPFPDSPELWIDPVTGLAIPKALHPNLEWRKEILKRASSDRGFQQEMYTAASQSILFWVNAFVWTYRLFRIGPDGLMKQCTPQEAHVPFITWEIQDTHILEIESAINDGFDLLTDKSRDMGATWDHIDVIYHKWLFKSDRSFLLLSRKEDCVDSSGRKGLLNPADPGTLFGKVDYISSWMPKWMMPLHTRTTMHLVNNLNGSRIDGESANATAGSSDRRTAILLDEMAKMAEGESIKRSTRDVTACRLANSTVWGAGTAYSKWKNSGKVKVFKLPWWEHPEKGFRRKWIEDSTTGKRNISSPWYAEEEKIRSPREMASEIDMNDIGSGEMFFDQDIITKHRAAFVRKSIGIKRHITFKRDIAISKMPDIIHRNMVDCLDIQSMTNGPWTFWINLVNGRPDQTLNYIFGIDISKGMGASNSVISVVCIETKTKVAEWTSANFAPHDFAIMTAASAIWFGGSQRGHRPFIIWESNGDPGIAFGRVLVRELKYPACYLDRQQIDKLRVPKAKKYGWHSSPEKKADLLGEYRRALAHGTYMNTSEMALNEAEEYVYFSGEGIGPASLQEESASARKTHGDRVIGDALTVMGLGNSRVVHKTTIDAPQNSFGQRFQDWKKKKQEKKLKNIWDFRK